MFPTIVRVHAVSFTAEKSLISPEAIIGFRRWPNIACTRFMPSDSQTLRARQYCRAKAWCNEMEECVVIPVALLAIRACRYRRQVEYLQDRVVHGNPHHDLGDGPSCQWKGHGGLAPRDSVRNGMWRRAGQPGGSRRSFQDPCAVTQSGQEETILCQIVASSTLVKKGQ